MPSAQRWGGGQNFAAALCASAALHALLLSFWPVPEIKAAPARPKRLEARLALAWQESKAGRADGASQGPLQAQASESAPQKGNPANPAVRPNSKPGQARHVRPESAKPDVPAQGRSQAKATPAQENESAAAQAQPAAKGADAQSPEGGGQAGLAPRGPSARGQEGSGEVSRASPMGYGQRDAVPYPAEALRRRMEGTARIWVRVDASGQVIEAKVAASSGFAQLDKAALEAVSGWKFRPGKKNGEPAESSEAFVPVVFKAPEI